MTQCCSIPTFMGDASPWCPPMRAFASYQERSAPFLIARFAADDAIDSPLIKAPRRSITRLPFRRARYLFVSSLSSVPPGSSFIRLHSRFLLSLLPSRLSLSESLILLPTNIFNANHSNPYKFLLPLVVALHVLCLVHLVHAQVVPYPSYSRRPSLPLFASLQHPYPLLTQSTQSFLAASANCAPYRTSPTCSPNSPNSPTPPPPALASFSSFALFGSCSRTGVQICQDFSRSGTTNYFDPAAAGSLRAPLVPIQSCPQFPPSVRSLFISY